MRMQVLRGISSATDRIAMHGPQQIDMTVRASNAYGWVASGGRDVESTPPKFAGAEQPSIGASTEYRKPS